jgi:glycosyltransferase involved in cell wall biosynthesis
LADSQTGRLVACDTPGPLAAALVDLLDNPVERARMGALGREWAVERFDWRALSKQARQLFTV